MLSGRFVTTKMYAAKSLSRTERGPSDWQRWHLVRHTPATILDTAPRALRPIVPTIDNSASATTGWGWSGSAG